MPAKPSSPFPLTMEIEYLDRLNEPVRDGKAKSVSEIIRTALERYDFANVVVMHPAQVQLSVRLPVEMRRMLKKVARSRHTSEGQLVRAAVEAYLPELEAAPSPEAKKPKPRRKRPAAKKRRVKKRAGRRR